MNLRYLLTRRIDTIDEARKINNGWKWHHSHDDETRSFALKRWNELYLPKLDAVIAAGNVEEFFKAVFSSEFPPEGEAREKAIKWFEGTIDLMSIAQMLSLYNKFASDIYESDSFATMIKKRWDALSRTEIEKANDFEALKAASENIRYEGDVIDILVLKWVNQCQSFEQIQEVSTFAGSHSYKLHPETHKKIHQKRDTILFVAIPKARDTKTIKSYYAASLEGGASDSAVPLLALEQWLTICATPEEGNEAFKAASASGRGNRFCIIRAYERVRALCQSN